jgi:tetratricopeptide (TPR) repeat protein
MTLWRLQTLGTMTLTRVGDSEEIAPERSPPIGFKNRPTWILLASLATDPSTSHREELAVRLLTETATPRSTKSQQVRFRSLVFDLIHGDKKKGYVGIGEESLLSDKKTVKLKPGTLVTDIEEAETIYQQAKAISDAGEAIKLLRQAAQLLQGSFLAGLYPPPAAAPWYNGLQGQVDNLRHSIWTQLQKTAEASGDTFLQAESWRQLQGLDNPDSSEFEENATFQPQLPGSKVEGTDSSKQWPELLSYLEQKEKSGLRLSVREERMTLDTLDSLMAQLPKEEATLFRSCSVFPQPFTKRQAAAVALVPEDTLVATMACLRKVGLLQKIPSSESVESKIPPQSMERYFLPPFVGPLVWQRLGSSQKKRLRLRHAQYFLDVKREEWQNYQRWLYEEKANILQTLVVGLESLPIEKLVGFVQQIDWITWFPKSDENISTRDTVLCLVTPHFITSIDSMEHDLTLKGQVALLLSIAAKSKQDYQEAIRWAKVSQSCEVDWNQREVSVCDNESPMLLRNMIQQMLEVTHHAGLHAEFDEAMKLARRLVPKYRKHDDLNEIGRLRFRQAIRHYEAENHWARGALDAAYKASSASMADRYSVIALNPSDDRSFASGYYQRGCIQWARGNKDAALADWNEALARFIEDKEQHGVADCKKRLGRVFAEMGHHAIGQQMIREAIAIYTEQENEASRTAAQGTLADALLLEGKIDEAIPYYQEGLSYWRTANHSGWIDHFETALARVEQITRTHR